MRLPLEEACLVSYGIDPSSRIRAEITHGFCRSTSISHETLPKKNALTVAVPYAQSVMSCFVDSVEVHGISQGINRMPV
jgi:hypothetical protein